MRIYFSSDETPVLLDSLTAMNALHRRLEAFLSSGDESIRLEAERWGAPDPYDEFLGGLEVQKGEGALMLSLTPSRWLHITGAMQNLVRYVSHFRFEEDNTHHHPEYVKQEGYIQPGSLPLIIEVCSGWMEDLRLAQR